MTQQTYRRVSIKAEIQDKELRDEESKGSEEEEESVSDDESEDDVDITEFNTEAEIALNNPLPVQPAVLHKRFVCSRQQESWKDKFLEYDINAVAPTKMVMTYWPNEIGNTQHEKTFLGANTVLNQMDIEIKKFHRDVGTPDWEDDACRIVITNAAGAALLGEVVNKNYGGSMANQMPAVVLSLPWNPSAEVTLRHKDARNGDLYRREDIYLWTYIPTSKTSVLHEQVKALTDHFVASYKEMDPIYTPIVQGRQQSYTLQRQTKTNLSKIYIEHEGDVFNMLSYLGHFIATRLCTATDNVWDLMPALQPELFPSLDLDVDARPLAVQATVAVGRGHFDQNPYSLGHTGWLGVSLILHPLRKGVYMATEHPGNRGDGGKGPELRFLQLQGVRKLVSEVTTAMKPYAGWVIDDAASCAGEYGYHFSRMLIEMVFAAAEDMDADRNTEDSVSSIDHILECMKYHCEWKIEGSGQLKTGRKTLTLYKESCSSYKNTDLEKKKELEGLWLKTTKKQIKKGTRIVSFAGRWMTAGTWYAVRDNSRNDGCQVDGEHVPSYKNGHHMIPNREKDWPGRWSERLVYVTYPTQANNLRHAKFGYNCEPRFNTIDYTTVYRSTQKPFFQVYATRDIEPGEELVISYDYRD